MPRTCRVCESPRLEEIDARIAAGDPIPPIARDFGIPASNLYRHRDSHMNILRAITQSRPAATLATVERLELLDQQLVEVLGIALRRSHTQAAVAAIDKRFRIAMAIAEFRNELQPKKTAALNVNVDMSAKEALDIATAYTRHREFTEAEGAE